MHKVGVWVLLKQEVISFWGKKKKKTFLIATEQGISSCFLERIYKKDTITTICIFHTQ